MGEMYLGLIEVEKKNLEPIEKSQMLKTILLY